MMCFAVRLDDPYGQAGDATVSTLCLKRMSARSVFSARICVASEFSALTSPSWTRIRLSVRSGVKGSDTLGLSSVAL